MRTYQTPFLSVYAYIVYYQFFFGFFNFFFFWHNIEMGIDVFEKIFFLARQKLKKKILGVTCHNSKLFAKNAIREKADYLAFGSFYKSKLKPKSVKAKLSILKWSLKNFKKPNFQIKKKQI